MGVVVVCVEVVSGGRWSLVLISQEEPRTELNGGAEVGTGGGFRRMSRVFQPEWKAWKA